MDTLEERRRRYSQELSEYSLRQFLHAREVAEANELKRIQHQQPSLSPTTSNFSQSTDNSSQESQSAPMPVSSLRHVDSAHRPQSAGSHEGAGGSTTPKAIESVGSKVVRAVVKAVDFGGSRGTERKTAEV